MRLSRTTWATLAVFVALAFFYLLVLSAAQTYYVPASPPLSTFSTSTNGLAGLYRYLGAAGVRVERLMQYETLPDPTTGVIVVAGPLLRSLTPARVEQLRKWVARGGWLLIAATEPSPLHELAGVKPGGTAPAQPSDTGEPVAAIQATRLTTGVSRVRLKAARTLGPVGPEAVVHLGEPGGERLVSVSLGRGTVVVLADEWAISNAGLAEEDNLQLALNLVLPPGRMLVAFDEYHHGYASGGGAWARLSTGARLSLTQLALAAAALVVARRRRLGTPQAAAEVSRRSAVEYVESLGALLRRAKARPQAAAVLARGLSRDLTARFGGCVHDPEATSRLLAERGWGHAAQALAAACGDVADDAALLDLAKIMAEARREVAGAYIRRSDAR